MAWGANEIPLMGTGKSIWPRPRGTTWYARLSHLWRCCSTWDGWTYRPCVSWLLYLQLATLMISLYGLLSVKVKGLVQGHDKVAHALGFGWWTLLLYPSWQPAETNRKVWSTSNGMKQRLNLTALACFTAAIASECLQWLSRTWTGRTFSLADLMADTFGIMVGLVLASLCHLGYITCFNRDRAHRQEEMDAWHI